MKSNSLKKYLLISITILSSFVAFTGCEKLTTAKDKIASLVSGSTKKQTNDSKTPSISTDSATFEVKVSKISDMRELRGRLQASERVEIRADKRVRIGPAKPKQYQSIKKGAVLFEVDTKELAQKQMEMKERLEQGKIDLASAKSQLNFAKKQQERKSALSKKGIAPQKELEEANKQLEQAQSAEQTKQLELRKAERELVLATSSLSSANILSPIDGIVANIISGADEVNVGVVLASIANPQKLSVFVDTDETLVTKLPIGFEAVVKIDAVPNRSFRGIVKSSVISDANKSAFLRQYETKIDLLSEETKGLNLKDGFEATVTAVFRSSDKAVTVPLGALKKNGRDDYVLVVSKFGGLPTARPVKVGITTDLEAEVKEGVVAGEFVVATIKESQKPS